MNIDDCYQLGYIVRKHGLKGEVYAHLDADEPERYQDLESVFVVLKENNVLIPFIIEYINIKDQNAIIKFEEIDDADKAENLKSCQLYLPLEFLPELEENQFYYHEIVGFRVIDKNEGELGSVKNVYEVPNQDLIVMHYKSKEVLIPINDDIVNKVDKEKQVIYTTLPEGLLEIYL